MGNGLYTFNDVTLLITHYNRSASLERLLNAFNRLNCTFAEIIVSDDASKADHFKRIQELQDEYGFNLLITHHNKGLGNNINKGQDAVKTPYTLYVQEDFIPKDAFPEHFTDALQLMDENPELDIARFYAYFKYPYLAPFAKGFARMKFKFWYPGYMKFYSYSDHPHLRRSTFFQKFGRYLEGVNGDKTEYNMCLSFLKNGGKGIFYNHFTTLFDQKNTSSEPSTADFRLSWTQRKNIFVRILRKVYLQYKFLKFSWDYLFIRKLPMNNAPQQYTGVTLLITHYNRSSSLERLLKTFRDSGYRFDDIVVSDDGSKAFHLDELKRLQAEYDFQLSETPVNKGLGNNINKGQDLVKTPLTLYVQEDFVPRPLFKEKLADAVAFMNERPDIDVVRFYAYFKYPYLKPYKNGFSEMIFNIWNKGYKKFYYYSDHPHLRRSSFFEKFGRYAENTKPDVTEYRMMMSFLKHKGKALYYDDYTGLFDQVNSQAEPSMVKRNYWRNSNNPFVTLVRHGYRYLKFNWDLLT